jgi:hypothetical protein
MPNWELRQGCPLFIIAMEFLTKNMEFSLSKKEILGIKLTRTVPPLMHVIYVDDLMVMGSATTIEV